MTDDLLPVLARFHREMILPDLTRVVGESERRLRDEMHTLFDAVAERLDRLETEYHTISAGLKRFEERLDRRSELLELKGRVEALSEQLRQIEARLEE